jgi:hypothetical protein
VTGDKYSRSIEKYSWSIKNYYGSIEKSKALIK